MRSRARFVTLYDADSICHASQVALSSMSGAGVLRTIKNKIKEIYGDDAFSWFDNSFIVDWQVSKGPLEIS